MTISLISSFKITITGLIGGLGLNKRSFERWDVSKRKFKMAGEWQNYVELLKIYMDFAKILRSMAREVFRFGFSVFERGKLCKNISVPQRA